MAKIASMESIQKAVERRLYNLIGRGGGDGETIAADAKEITRLVVGMLEQRPTMDSYLAVCRAHHWHVAQMRAHGIEPIAIPSDAKHYPPPDYDFGQTRERTSIKRSHRAEGRNVID